MTAYIDTSALLRLILREPGALSGLRAYDALVSSSSPSKAAARSTDCACGARINARDPEDVVVDGEMHLDTAVVEEIVRR